MLAYWPPFLNESIWLVAEFYQLCIEVDSCRTGLEHVKIIRSSSPNEYMVLLKFRALVICLFVKYVPIIYIVFLIVKNLIY